MGRARFASLHNAEELVRCRNTPTVNPAYLFVPRCMFVRASFRSQVRTFALSSKRYVSRRPPHIKASDLFKELSLLPDNAPLKLISYMARRRPDELADLLESDARLRRFKDVWTPVLTAPDFKTIEDVFSSTKAKMETVVTPDQPWQPLTHIFYHIIMNRANTHDELIQALALIEEYIPMVPTPSQPALIVSIIARLAELRLAAPLRRLVEYFQNIPSPSEEYYNLLLRALALGPGSKDTSALAISLIADIARQGYTLHKETYNALLRPPFANLEVAKEVEKRLKVLQFEPTLQHLEAFLRLMIQHGRKKDASRFLASLRAKETSARSRLPSTDSVTHWDSLFVGSFRNSAAAYRHMKGLAEAASRDVKEALPIHTSDRTPLTPLRSSEAVSPSASQRPDGSQDPSDNNRLSQDSTVEPNPPSRIPTVSHSWLSTLRVAARDRTFTPDAFLSTFRRGSAQFGAGRTAYELAISGMLRKGGIVEAAMLWNELRNTGWPLGTTSLALGVHTLTLDNQAHGAFSLLEEASAACPRRHRRLSKHEVFSQPVDVQAVNQFMVALRRIGRPDAVLTLWDSMGVLYGLSPDVYTLNIVLGTARWARKVDGSLKGVLRSALAELGLSRSHNSLPLSQATSKAERRQELAFHLSALLDSNRTSTVTGQWGSEPASRVALRITVQVLLGNWPYVKQIRSPVHAIRKTASDAALSPLSDAFHSLSHNPQQDAEKPSVLIDFFPKDTPKYPYPSIYPTDVTFRAFLDLLAAESMHAEIPVALAWMRALKVRASKTTLATALVHWMEVSMDAPLIERFKGGPSRSPYTALMSWMRDWVGESNMPTRVEMSNEMARLAFYRHSRYDGRAFVITDPSGNVSRRRFQRPKRSHEA